MAKNPSAEGTSDRSAVDRLIDIDLARGVAVFGMYVAHVGGDPSAGLIGNLIELPLGRSSTLFAVLAGFSIILITGRKAPKSGEAGGYAVARVAIRALALLAIGSILTCLGTRVAIILENYGICFFLVLPLYRLSAQQLGLLAAGTALVLPQMRYLLELFGPEHHLDPVFDFMVRSTYPVMTWVPFMITDMAIARLSLKRKQCIGGLV
ncbi:heparan-alpha-glucosaminide N-acetyltransferase domain-containing protein [Rhizobium laguerreae]|uniref:heparan-alpha-glucosaminide N-acetyltransferase domain-containing protein n=1 Tax=Rhizobium laguerreae TaxID=1076926 RepID=UPI001FEF3FEA|nr:heparan-alpha-glucosaminide N-acetyltransferase domain-containing protein [Rhizobium laguerreae]